MAGQPIPAELRYPYAPGVTYSSPLPTGVRHEASRTFDQIEATTNLLAGTLPELLVTLNAASAEAGSEAGMHLRRILLVLGNLSEVLTGEVK